MKGDISYLTRDMSYLTIVMWNSSSRVFYQDLFSSGNQRVLLNQEDNLTNFKTFNQRRLHLFPAHSIASFKHNSLADLMQTRDYSMLVMGSVTIKKKPELLGPHRHVIWQTYKLHTDAEQGSRCTACERSSKITTPKFSSCLPRWQTTHGTLSYIPSIYLN